MHPDLFWRELSSEEGEASVLVPAVLAVVVAWFAVVVEAEIADVAHAVEEASGAEFVA